MLRRKRIVASCVVHSRQGILCSRDQNMGKARSAWGRPPNSRVSQHEGRWQAQCQAAGTLRCCVPLAANYKLESRSPTRKLYPGRAVSCWDLWSTNTTVWMASHFVVIFWNIGRRVRTYLRKTLFKAAYLSLCSLGITVYSANTQIRLWSWPTWPLPGWTRSPRCQGVAIPYDNPCEEAGVEKNPINTTKQNFDSLLQD